MKKPIRPNLRRFCILILAALACQTTVPAGATAQGLALTTDSEAAKAAFLEGLYLRQNGDREKAVEAYARATELDPDFVVARAMGVHADTRLSPRERYDRLGEALVELADAAPDELLLVLAYRQWMKGALDGDFADANRSANRLFDALRSLAPESPHAAWGYAQSRVGWLFGTADRTRAFREAIDRFPDYAPLYNNFAYLLANTGDMVGARKAVSTFLTLAPESPNAHDSYAEIMQWSGLFSESIKHYGHAFEMGAGFAQHGVADVQQLRGYGNAARQTLLSSLEATDTAIGRLPILRAIAFSHLRDGQVEEGIARLEQVTEVGEESGYDAWAAHAYRELALLDAMMRDGSQVDAYFDKAHELQPGPNSTWWQACAYAETGRLEEARQAEKEHAKAFPGELDTQWRASLDGMLRLHEGDVDGAIAALMDSGLANPWAKAFMALAQGAAGNASDSEALANEVRGSYVLDLANSNLNFPTLLLDHMQVAQ